MERLIFWVFFGRGVFPWGVCFCVCVCVYYCRTYYKAVRGGGRRRVEEVMIVLLLFLQKQNLAFAVYQFGSVLSLHVL